MTQKLGRCLLPVMVLFLGGCATLGPRTPLYYQARGLVVVAGAWDQALGCPLGLTEITGGEYARDTTCR